jgi:putative Mg2+ transporter-C (MgtC) family protein
LVDESGGWIAMEQFWQELTRDWPETAEALHTAFRLILAAAVGALPGWQREVSDRAAGLRTHMLVSVGAALFVLTGSAMEMSPDAMSRVVQGIAAGIGFVGAGSILKSAQNQEVRGLTTASSVWLTAAAGTAAGAGQVLVAVGGSVVAFAVLSLWTQAKKETLITPGGSDRVG